MSFWLVTGILVVLYAAGLLYLRRGFAMLTRPMAFNETTPLPRVTVVVSLHNEARNVDGLLPALMNQEYPSNRLEFILVDDRSTDNTHALLQQWSQRDPRIRILRIVETPPDFAPKKYALQQAVQQATGDIILQTDADGRPLPRWVKQMVAYFTPEVGVVLGYAPYRTEPPFHAWWYQILALEYCSNAAIAMATTGFQQPATAIGTNLAYRKAVFQQVDGYGKFRAIPSGDDDLFVQRVRRHTRWKFAFAAHPDAAVWNDPPASFRQFYFQRLRFASKGFLYPKPLVAILTTFYLMNLLLFIGPVLAMFTTLPFTPWLLLYLLKMGAEWRFLSAICGCFQQQDLLTVLPIASMLHIPYVLYFGAAAQFKEYRWKDITGKGSLNYFSSN